MVSNIWKQYQKILVPHIPKILKRNRKSFKKFTVNNVLN